MKRLLCFVLAFSMLLMMPVALAEGETPTLTVSEVQGEVGDRVTVVGSITDAPRCASFRIILTYDSACLKIFPDECVVGEDVTGNASINASALYQEKNAVLVMSVDTTKVIEGDAELFVLQFEVIAEPTSGYSTPITVDYQEFFNASLQKVTPTIQNGGVIYPSLDGGNYTDFAGGEGTVSSPYLVKNANHLNNVRKYLNAHFKMIADIEFSDADFAEGGSFYNGGAGWAPIGTDAASAFAGSFDGNGHVIRNLCININDDTDVYAGLFGYSKGIVQNLGMLNGEITVKHTTAAGAYAGSIAGCVESGTVRDCYSTCNVTTDWYSGGIVGRAYSAVIKDCFNTGNIVADYSAGGVTALASGSVRDCYNAGAITAGYYSGGIVGYNEQNAIIERCYNCGNVTVTESSSFEIMAHAGGIAGMSAADSLIRNCYNAGSISAQPSSGDLRSNAGGIAGYIYSAMVGDCYNVGVISGNYSGGIVAVNASGTIDGCYYLNTMDHGVGNGADTAITATANDLKTRATFLGYDFDTVWTFDGDLDYPYPVLQSMIHFELTSIAITALPAKVTYLEGDAFDSTGMVVTASYTNGMVEPVVGYTVSGYDSTPGTKNIVVAYNGKTTGFTVEVASKTLTSIAITSMPAKLTYQEGERFDATGMVVTAYYNNNTNAMITDYTVSGYTSIPGTKTITVSYGGKTAKFNVVVTPSELTSIAVTTLPSKRTYLEGESFDPTGMVVTAYYNNNTNEAVTDYTISGYTSTPGTKRITITYGGKTAQFNVTVNAKELTSIAVTTKPTKTTYLEGESFNASGMVITAHYKNAASQAVTGYTVSGYDSTPGTKTITVAYQGKTADFQVTVRAKSVSSISITSEPTTKNYIQGESLDLVGMKVLVQYNNNTQETITQGWTVSGNTNTIGEQTVTVTYGGKSAFFKIYVVAPFPFVDVSAELWYRSAVEYCYANGLMNGVTATTFDPDGTMTRAMVVTVLYRISGSPAVSGSAGFSDVSAEMWYAEEVAWAAQNGIANGVGDNRFAPEDIITREQFVTMLYRYAQKNGDDTSARKDLFGFADQAEVSSWAKDAVQWAVAEGIINGIAEGGKTYFKPAQSASRAQAAKMLMYYVENR